MSELLPKYLADRRSSYVASYKMGFRKWDASEEIMLKLI
jgi:ribosomal protein L17